MATRFLIAVLAIAVGTGIIQTALTENHEERAIQEAQGHLAWAQLEEARDVLSAALEVVPNSARLRDERSKVFASLARWRGDAVAGEAAIIEKGLAVAANPLHSGRWGEYALLLQENGRPTAAIAAVQRGLERDPNNLYLLAVLGQSQLVAGQPQEAVRTLERAQRIQSSAAVRDLLAQANEALETAE